MPKNNSCSSSIDAEYLFIANLRLELLRMAMALDGSKGADKVVETAKVLDNFCFGYNMTSTSEIEIEVAGHA